MPNPSTIAMEEEAQTNLVPVEINTVPDSTPEEVIEQLEAQANRAEQFRSESETLFGNLVDAIEQQDALKQSLAILSKDLLNAQESRDRVLRANCEMTQTLRDLAEIARAAERFMTAVRVFHNSEDAVTPAMAHECGDSEGMLETLLEKHAKLFRRP